MTCVCGRYFNVFGPRQDPSSHYSGVISIFVDRFAEGRPATVYGDGTQSRDFISVYDIARANVLAATKPGVHSGAYNFCSGKSQTLLDLIEVLQREFPFAPPVRFAEARDGDIRHSQGDPRRAARLLGFEAEQDFDHALVDLIEERRRSSGLLFPAEVA